MLTTHESLQKIVDNKKEKSLNYAVNYAEYGLGLLQGSHEMKVQCLYVLNNMTHWRGELAKEVRAALKKEVGIK